ncbi:MAG TPA: YeeE/YedE thiosulfate transporter family protein [Bacteroidota bacterium]|nr:YeeE/YedE thiosulfate transporter family protein [Bacteroidota bacterium]
MHADAHPLPMEPVETHTHHAASRAPQPYMHPYLAGFGLGLVLLASFVIMGRGLGASGAFSSLVAFGADAIASEHTRANAFYAEYLGDGTRHPLMDWLVFEVVGVFAGGFLSGILAGRVRTGIERGPSATNRMRLLYAFAGGGLMGIGAKLARGCTSGQALTGGALLNVGSWAFMMCVFAGAYAVAYFVRRQWQ